MGAPFELSAVLTRYNNDWKLLGELVKLFGECSARYLDEIRAALARNDLAQAGDVAHMLKGSVANFLAHDAWAKVTNLEKACKAGDAPGALQEFAVTESAILQVSDALKSLVAPT